MQPVPLKRVFFWVLYVLGNLFLAFRGLLGLVPGGIHDFKMFLFYFGADAIPAILLLACYLLYNKIMDPRNWKNEGVPSGTYRAFGVITSLELAVCVLLVGAMMFYYVFELK